MRPLRRRTARHRQRWLLLKPEQLALRALRTAEQVQGNLNCPLAVTLSACYFFGSAAATLVGAIALLSTLGLTTWQLQAPFLIDSYPLLGAVLASPLPGQMLAGLHQAGFTGLGLYPDQLRHLVGFRKPLFLSRPLPKPNGNPNAIDG